MFEIVAAGLALSVTGTAQGQSRSETAVLAGGCYWGVESVYRHVKGVRDVVSGYAGESRSDLSRHKGDDGDFAEAVRITYDPAQISYDHLLQIFFDVAHDPTQLNRQGPDAGPRYRSAIFPQNREQRNVAVQYLAKLRSSNEYTRPITTTIESGGFEIAAPDQQDYVRKHPAAAYVIQNDVPKLAELKRRYPEVWRD